jgi:pimeloyl-ACP methyl ester carboxylesterase
MRSYDIGGRTMHIVCVGPVDTRQATILLEAGGGDDYRTWARILPEVSSTRRVCAYDRAGLGLSQPRPERLRTSADQVDDLAKLLQMAGVRGPFVIGAHSYGALPAILFTQSYPGQVAGLALIDPEAPEVSAQFLGALPDEYAGEPMAIAAVRSVLEDAEIDAMGGPEHLDLRSSRQEAARAIGAPGSLFGDRPVAVLSARRSVGTEWRLPVELSSTIDHIWFGSHRQLADESTAGWVETVPDSGHDIHIDQPQAVIDALETILGELADS